MEDHLILLTGDIVSAYVSSHQVPAEEIPALITGIYNAFRDADNPLPQPEPEVRARRKITRRRAGVVEGLSDSSDEESPVEDSQEENTVEGWDTGTPPAPMFEEE